MGVPLSRLIVGLGYCSEPLPFILVDSGLPQDPGEKIPGDVVLVRVGQRQPGFPFDHVLVFATPVGTFNSSFLR